MTMRGRSFKCEDELWQRTTSAAAARGTDVSAVIRAAMERYARAHERETIRREERILDGGYTLRSWTGADATDRFDLFSPSGWRIGIFKTERGALRRHEREIASK